jgi:hypothetical protein
MPVQYLRGRLIFLSAPNGHIYCRSAPWWKRKRRLGSRIRFGAGLRLRRGRRLYDEIKLYSINGCKLSSSRGRRGKQRKFLDMINWIDGPSNFDEV